MYGITGDQWSPLRNEEEKRKMCRGGHWPPECEVYGKRATAGRPYEMRGKRGKCVGAVIDRPSGKHMKKKEGEEGR